MIVLPALAALLLVWPVRSERPPVPSPLVARQPPVAFDQIKRPGVVRPGWEVPVGPTGRLAFHGRLDPHEDHDEFRLVGLRPGPVGVAVIPLRPGLKLRMRNAWETADRRGDSNTDVSWGKRGRSGRAFDIVRQVLPPPDNWIEVHLKAIGVPADGAYVVCVWRPGSPDDKDPDVIAHEATPVRVPRSGWGMLPATPDMTPPRIDFPGDVDVFRVPCPDGAEVVFTVDGTPGGLGMRLRAFGASGNLMAQTGAPRASVVQLSVRPPGDSDLYFVVTAWDPTVTGTYFLRARAR